MAKEMLCTNCGFRGRPKKFTKGYFVIELLLWLLFIVPGLIYTVWRTASRWVGCPKCKAPNMIPLDSPKAQELLGDR